LRQSALYPFFTPGGQVWIAQEWTKRPDGTPVCISRQARTAKKARKAARRRVRELEEAA
jgi:hypothetical protein